MPLSMQIHIISDRWLTYRDWFQGFKNADFYVEGQQGGKRLVSKSSGVTQFTKPQSHETESEARNWESCKLKSKGIECRSFVCKQLLERQGENSFLHFIATANDKLVHRKA